MDEKIDEILIALHFRNSAIILPIVIMRLEADCIAFKIKSERLLESHIIPSGDWKKIDFLGRNIEVAIFCDLKSEKGSILIRDPKNTADVCKFENLNDEEGQEADISSKIEIEKEQEVTVTTENKKSGKQIRIFLTPDEHENIPQEDFDEPSDPLLTAS